jgi:hypothetical protein
LLAELLAELVVIVIMMRLEHHNFLVVVMALPIAVVISVGLDDDRILGACRDDRQNERDRSESGNRQSNIAH